MTDIEPLSNDWSKLEDSYPYVQEIWAEGLYFCYIHHAKNFCREL